MAMLDVSLSLADLFDSLDDNDPRQGKIGGKGQSVYT
jgi:hypothetical protein